MKSKFLPSMKVNVGKNERLLSVAAAGALGAFALTRRSIVSLPVTLGAGYLLFRGLSGKCLVYEALDITRVGENGAGGIKVEQSMTINRPRQEVYEFWRNFENFPRFMEHLDQVNVIGDVHGAEQSHWVAKAPLGQTVEWDAEISEEKANEIIAWRSLPGSEVDNSGMVQFVDAPGGRGTEFKVLIKYQPPGGSASAAVAKLFREEPAIQIRDDLRRFKQMIETGEVATVFGQTSGRLKQVEEERGQIQKRKRKDVVQKASEDSFPASDPPGWTTSR